MTYIMSLYFQFQFFGLYNLGWQGINFFTFFHLFNKPFIFNTKIGKDILLAILCMYTLNLEQIVYNSKSQYICVSLLLCHPLEQKQSHGKI